MAMTKPEKCCPRGSYECTVPMPINGRVHGIDYCIADLVAALNAAGISTVASCCGHGNESIARISLEDGRELSITGHTPVHSGLNTADPDDDVSVISI